VHNSHSDGTLTLPAGSLSLGIELLIFHFTAFDLVLNLDRHLPPRPALPTWSPCLFPSPPIPSTLLSGVFTGHELEADWIFSLSKADSVCLNEALLHLRCNVYTSPLWAVLCAWLLQLQEAWYIWGMRRETVPARTNSFQASARSLDQECWNLKDITSDEKKQHDASALIYDFSHHVFRWLAYFSNGSASVLAPHSGSSHRVFRLDLIRQHPATSGLVKLFSG